MLGARAKIDGVPIEPGTRVFALMWAAHLTEALFPNPKNFDVTRNVAPVRCARSATISSSATSGRQRCSASPLGEEAPSSCR